ISSFDYKNSKGEKLDNLLSGNYNFIGLGFKLPFFVDNLSLATGLTYNQYGASGSELAYFYKWDLTYLGANVGFEYDVWHASDFFNKRNGFVKDREGLKFFLKAAFSGEFLVRGTQQINAEAYNLVGAEQFDAPYFFVRGGGGMRYGFSEDIGIFIQYLYGRSLPLISSSDDNEELNLIIHQFGLGVLIGLNHK
ncbi:MAG: hypothetical protein AAGI07_18585, partial [Bacteroidota bacterium]